MTPNGTSAATARSAIPAGRRVDWVDYAKGICIVMVVMMHSVLGVEKAADQTGFMHLVVMFAKPFRMPDFFLISGLFLSVVIDRDWRIYLDRKVVHFAYFYVLWVTIQFGFKAPSLAAEAGWSHVGLLYLESFIEPFGTLWFIYLLPIFFVVTKLTRKMPPLAILAVAAALEMAHVADRLDRDRRILRALCLFLFRLSVRALRLRAVRSRAGASRAGAGGPGAVGIRQRQPGRFGVSEWPIVSLALGLAGASAIIVTGTLLARMQWLNFLRYCGEHSIVIYLAFFLPMAATRTLLLRAGVIHDIGTVSLIVTIVGVAGVAGDLAGRAWRSTPTSCSNAPRRSGSRRKRPRRCCRRRSRRVPTRLRHQIQRAAAPPSLQIGVSLSRVAKTIRLPSRRQDTVAQSRQHPFRRGPVVLRPVHVGHHAWPGQHQAAPGT